MANADERRSGRAVVILTAAIEAGDARIPVRVSNLSAHGVLVIGDKIPAASSQVVFRCNGIAVPSWVAWSHDGRAGIQFDDPVEPDQLAQKTRVPLVPVMRDTRTIDSRRPGFKGNQLTNEERNAVEAWLRSNSRAGGERS